MRDQVIRFWKRSPFVRLLIPLLAGILLQWNFQFPAAPLLGTMACTLFILAGFFLLPLFRRYQLSFFNGIITCILFLSLGSFLTLINDVRHSPKWFGHTYTSSLTLIATIVEPPVEKARSIKAEASICGMIDDHDIKQASGKIIIYIQKDLPGHEIRYGNQVLIKKPLQIIRNSGNPGAFDYRRYSLFHGITHQVYLGENDFEILDNKNPAGWLSLLYSIKEKILRVLRHNIPGTKELGLAEALLMGYKDDLDKSLVQSYSNTGVVHIIAISGLHLGLIYWLLVKLLQPLKTRKELSWIPPILIIAGLWTFSLLAGAQPSVLRSALMFTCIVAGESISRKTSIYNSLGLSAFLLLCYNPYWLWDVGFQLSYAAVLSIIIFMRPVQNIFYIKNKLLDYVWKLNAVTLSAQILTIPLTIYYFHQFPNYFLLSNFLAVPLSSLILIIEILLCLVAFIPAISLLIGQLLSWLIWLMNSYVEHIESFPFSIWKGLQINLAQHILLFILITGLAAWLMTRSVTGLKTALISLLAFAGCRSYSFINATHQQRIIIYNVPQKSAIDLISGRTCLFIGDSILQNDDFARNFHLAPSRILHRTGLGGVMDGFCQSGNYISWNQWHILLMGEQVSYYSLAIEPKKTIDLLVISGNPNPPWHELVAEMDIRQVVFDSSVPSRKANEWKKNCDSLRIRWHDVATNGAFAMNLR